MAGRLRIAFVLLLAGLGAAFVLLTAGGGGTTSECGTVPDVVTHGPRLGEVADSSLKVWVRTCEQVNVAVEYKEASGDWSAAQQSGAVLTDPLKDNTAVVSLTGLAASTAYDYRVLVEGQLPSKTGGGEFRTMPVEDSPSAFSFIISSDMHNPYQPTPDTIVNLMTKRDPDFAFMLGDQIVIEIVLNNLGRCCTPQSQADYELAYRDMYDYGPFANFVANTPTMLTWDDHEILNDWDLGPATPYPWARAAFEEYQGSANPDPLTPAGIQYVYKAGETEFFVLDTRTFRSPGEMPDGPGKTMLGAQQKQALKDWLLTSGATFKFIVSSVMWSDFAGHTIYGESWPAFATERNEIFDFIKDNRISGVMLFSGDEHTTRVFHIDPWGLYEVAPNPLGWKVGSPDPPDPEILYQAVFTRMFGLLSVDTTSCPATLTVELIGENNQTHYTLPLTEADLDSDRDDDGLLTCEEEALGTDPVNPDTDGDGCSDSAELGPLVSAGGQRSPTNPWDYFNPTGDGFNRVDDIITVVEQYQVDQGEPGYTPVTDRTLIGPQAWKLGAPNGLQRIDDVLNIIAQFFHDC